VRRDVVEIGASGQPATADDALSAFFATPLDPVSTGWELQVARQRAMGNVVVLARVHHALGDGLAVTDALLRLLADAPPPGPRRADGAVRPARRPRPRRRAVLLARGLSGLARAGPAGPSPLTGPSLLTGTATGSARHRGVSLDGARVRAAARRHGVGTTALLLALVAEALHGLLEERGAGDVAPGATVRAMVPMTTRTRVGVDSWAPGNRTGAVPVDLPVGAMPPAERVARVARAVAAGAGSGQPEAAAAVLALLGLLPGRAQTRFARTVYWRRLVHLIATMIPDVRRQPHLRGAAVREVFPAVPLAEGVGLAVGALHWGRGTCVGITADPALVPELATLPARLRTALAALDGQG
jgi:hypothetical protein